MDYRSSSWLAGLALLMASSGGFLAPTARAGDRIDFSAPAVPLAIPQPVVEKESQKLNGPMSAAEPAMDDVVMPPIQQITVVTPGTRQTDPWNMDSSGNDNQDPRNPLEMFPTRQDPSGLTNTAGFPMQHGIWGEPDSDRMLFRRDNSEDDSGVQGRDAFRLGGQDGSDKEQARDGNRSGRGSSSDNNDSFFLKVFNRDPIASEEFSAWGLTPPNGSGETGSLPAVASEMRRNRQAPLDSSRDIGAPPPGYGGYNPTDNRPDDQTADVPPRGYAQAWDTAPTRRSESRNYYRPAQISPSHVVAPNRPVILQIPKRPGDISPY